MCALAPMTILMANAAWLVAPYMSMLAITRWPPLGHRVAGHTAITLPIGWAGLVVLFGAVLEFWAVPVPVMIVAAAASGLAMLLTGRGGEGGDWTEPDDDPPPLIGEGRFHRASGGSGRFRRTGP